MWTIHIYPDFFVCLGRLQFLLTMKITRMDKPILIPIKSIYVENVMGGVDW